MCVNTYIYVDVYMYIYLYMYLYIYIYKYIHMRIFAIMVMYQTFTVSHSIFIFQTRWILPVPSSDTRIKITETEGFPWGQSQGL